MNSEINGQIRSQLQQLCSGLPLKNLPPQPTKERDPLVPHAPIRKPNLSTDEFKLALSNALRYFPSSVQSLLVDDFTYELRTYGHIYMYRFLPPMLIKSYPLELYPCKIPQASAIMLMIMNNLDPSVAQYPHELVTYGGNGQVFSNWAQFYLVMHYLSNLTNQLTLSMFSGHPLGLFPSNPNAPRVVITNGMVIPNYSSHENYEKMFALGVSMYGQMTAGSFAYIGPQGIVHGTTLTVLNAAKKHLGSSDLGGKVFLTSGLGGMSGAQAKAAVICGCVGVIAEVNLNAIQKRHKQGWLTEYCTGISELIDRLNIAVKARKPISIGYHGNIVELWEYFALEYNKMGKCYISLGSDQTSLHNPFGGGYIPVGYNEDEALSLMENDLDMFKNKVQESLRRQILAINTLSLSGQLYFWDYGNAFLLEANRAGAYVRKLTPNNQPEIETEISEPKVKFAGSRNEFRYPSYVQDIMGRIFSLGFGPFRWVCCSCLPEDLAVTDSIATAVIEERLASPHLPAGVRDQYQDNLKWIREASKHNLVVGSQARILYSDEKGRVSMALAFNEAISEGRLKGPVVLSRDHHDVSGTDSPFRETSNIYDGSRFCADMAVQNVIGCAFRGATWVSLHNGGGVGWGEVMNGGFGLVLDGSDIAESNARAMLSWDVRNGLTRRCWTGSEEAYDTINRTLAESADKNGMMITLPNSVSSEVIEQSINNLI